MLKNLAKRLKNESTSIKKIINSDIDFSLKNDLIYLIKDDKFRLCISRNCEQNVFKITHDENFHAEQHRAYEKLIKNVFISRMSRKLHLYIKHCLACQLNQIKRHLSYDELMSIFSSMISFRKLTMNFIVALSSATDSVLIVTCKTSRRLTIISEQVT
jgi:NAD-dependent dihydropyrimidine dehydrogenase PreA subunit